MLALVGAGVELPTLLEVVPFTAAAGDPVGVGVGTVPIGRFSPLAHTASILSAFVWMGHSAVKLARAALTLDSKELKLLMYALYTVARGAGGVTRRPRLKL